MSLTKTVTPILNGNTAAANNTTAIADCVSIDTSTTVNLAIHCKVTYNASATQAATVNCYGSDDDTWAATAHMTDPFFSFVMPTKTGGGQVRFGQDVPHGFKYIRVAVANPDPTYSLTDIVVNAHKQTAT